MRACTINELPLLVTEEQLQRLYIGKPVLIGRRLAWETAKRSAKAMGKCMGIIHSRKLSRQQTSRRHRLPTSLSSTRRV